MVFKVFSVVLETAAEVDFSELLRDNIRLSFLCNSRIFI